MAKKTLKEIFSIREIAINVPDDDLPALKKVVAAAIKAGQMSPSAKAWMGMSKNVQQEPGDVAPEKPSRTDFPVPGARSAKGTPPPIPQGKPSADPQSAWDALAPPAQKKEPKTKATPAPQKPVDPTASWAAPKSANVQLGPETPDDDAPYKSPFAWDKIDPDGTRGTDMDVPDSAQGNFKTLQPSAPKGPGLAGRVGGAIKNAFRGKPSDGRKELDKALASADKQANGKQSALSRIFKGKDVTRGQG